MSTFVRRALEADPRFVVTSRVATSRGAPAVTAGEPPAALAALPSLELFQTVIVGAPEELTADDAAGSSRSCESAAAPSCCCSIEPLRHTRRRSNALTGVAQWALIERGRRRGACRSRPPCSFRPTLPAWAERRGPSEREARRRSTAVWRTRRPGSLVVSGALDAWRYRDASDRRRLIAYLARRRLSRRRRRRHPPRLAPLGRGVPKSSSRTSETARSHALGRGARRPGRRQSSRPRPTLGRRSLAEALVASRAERRGSFRPMRSRRGGFCRSQPLLESSGGSGVAHGLR